jgi:serine/threonine protein kinase/tetratricopeptide (TPR) repeat protein
LQGPSDQPYYHFCRELFSTLFPEILVAVIAAKPVVRGGRVVRVGRGFDRAHLRAVVATLERLTREPTSKASPRGEPEYNAGIRLRWLAWGPRIMSRLFLSYRRADSPDTVKLLYERLVALLPGWGVFYDHESIGPGEAFPERLREEVTNATVVLAVIGPRWLELLRERRGAPVDHVREELRLAIESGRTVVPVPVLNAALPHAADLADFPELAALPSLNARPVRPDPDFNHDLELLVSYLEPLGPGVGVGTVLGGKYKVVQSVGEGGMGVVYRAEQMHPNRTVAVKLIKPGMDSKEVLARFDAERQALAMMEHPNIARVLDAGMTAAGRPFFVMDFVKGAPITDYCDDKKLPLADRLNLFCQVCDAVQHAHQKGIIHRDLKPSNVLVEVVDGKPVPKVIDFGLAKAMSYRLTDKTLVSEFGKTVGTLIYASPEQAAGKVFEIDTRTDIYSLGTLLYEMLAGSPPFTAEDLKTAGDEAMKQIIRDTEPPKPSTKLGSSASLPSIAANRHADPARLTRQLRGELDWIVMKALDKEPDRRYATATSFAEDVQRFLNHEPVTAGKPSNLHRLRKFVRRNRGAVAAVAAVFAVLLLGIAGTTAGILEARRQTGRALDSAAKEKEAKELAQERFAQLDQANGIIGRLVVAQDPFLPYEYQVPADVALARRLDEIAPKIDQISGGDALIRARVQLAIGMAWNSTTESAKAIKLLSPARATFEAELGPDDPVTIDAAMHEAFSLMQVQHDQAAVEILEPLLARCDRVLGPGHEKSEHVRYLLGLSLVSVGRAKDGVRHVEEMFAKLSKGRPPGDQQVMAYRMKLIGLYGRVGAQEKRKKQVDELLSTVAAHGYKTEGMNELGRGLEKFMDIRKAGENGDYQDAARTAFLGARKSLGPYHPSTCVLAMGLVDLQTKLGRLDDAIALGEELNRLLLERYGERHFLTAMGQFMLASAYFSKDNNSRAFALMTSACEVLLPELGAETPLGLEVSAIYSSCVGANGQLDEGLKRLRATIDLSSKVRGEAHPKTQEYKGYLVQMLNAMKRWDDAIKVTAGMHAASVAKFGPDAANALRYQFNHARELRDANEVDKAAEVWEDAVARAVKRFGMQDPGTRLVIGASREFYQTKVDDKAVPNVEMLRKSASLRTAALGADHAATAAAQRLLGESLLRSPATKDEGVELLERLVERRGKAPADDEFRALLKTLGRYYEDAADRQGTAAELERLRARAIKWFEAIRATRKDAGEKADYAAFVDVDLRLVDLYRNADDPAKALDAAKEANDLYKRVKSPEPIDEAWTVVQLVWSYQGAGKSSEALKLADQMTDAKLDRLPRQNDRWPSVVWFLASVYSANEKYDRARALFRQVAIHLERDRFANSESHKMVHDFIECCDNADDLDEAVVWQRKLAAAVGKSKGADSGAYAEEAARLGRLLVRQKKWPEAAPVVREALTLCERLAGEPKSTVEPWAAGNLRSILGECLFRQNKLAEAEPLISKGCDELFAHADTISAGDRAARLSRGTDRLVRLRVAQDQAGEGVKAADRYADWVDKLNAGRDEAHYDGACLFALCVRNEKPDAAALQKCLALLTKCRDAGYFKDAKNVKHFDEDEDFATVRADPKFAEFARSLKR